MKVTLIDNEDDWQVVIVNNTRFYEGHIYYDPIYTPMLLKALGVECERIINPDLE